MTFINEQNMKSLQMKDVSGFDEDISKRGEKKCLKKGDYCCFLNVTIPKIATFFMSLYKL